MSLVAYASSEEEEEEESDSAEEEEEEEEEEDGCEDGEPGAGEERSRGLFSALPPPRAAPGLPRLPPPPPPEASYPRGPSSPPPPPPPKPSRPRKRTQPVRIAAPQLHAGESDSEEEEPTKKQPAAAQGRAEGAGLSALLPQPRNLTVKETSRPLLPYAFTRKAAETSPAGAKGPAPSAPLKKAPLQPAPAAASVPTTPSPSAIKAAAKSAALQVTKQITQEENDSDEEVAPENYFSLPERIEPPAFTPQAYAFPGPTVPDDLPPGTEPEGQEAAGANAPLEFKTGAGAATHGWTPKPGEDHSSQPFAPAYYQQDYYSSGFYQQTEPAVGPQQEGSPAADPAPSSSSSSSSFFMDDEAFKRLQGKRNRGREEVNFLEIKGDDQLSGAQQWLTKSLTEEQSVRSFSKKKGEQPTGQQRRKHQITYLIHQAKERELELKNTWAENKLSRRQTQAKYGF